MERTGTNLVEESMIGVKGGLIRQLRAEGLELGRDRFCQQAIRLNYTLTTTNLMYIETGRTQDTLSSKLLAISETLRTVAADLLRKIENGIMGRPASERLSLLNQAARITMENLMERQPEEAEAVA